MDIPGPEIPENHPDRLHDCLLAVEPAFRALAEQAELAGWSREEVATALNGLAFSRMMMVREMAAEDPPAERKRREH